MRRLGDQAECGDRADTRYGHEPADLQIMTRQPVNLTVEIADLLLDGLARLEQLEMVGLASFASRRPRDLSGGQQQRVALARALISRPTVLLLDEPLGSLDFNLRQAMMIELKKLQRELNITFVMVTHSQQEALSLADKVIVMSDAVIQQIGTSREVHENPRTKFVAEFIGNNTSPKRAGLARSFPCPSSSG